MTPRLKLALFGGFSLLAVAGLVSLGLWQLRRLAWKEALIAEVDARVHAPAAPIVRSWDALSAATDEYRHVSLRGAYDARRDAFIFATPLNPRPGADSPGFLVVTPLKLDDGRIALIDRGFIEASQRDAFVKADSAAAQPEAEVTGLLRFDEPPRWFAPTDDLADRVFYTRNVKAIAASLGLSHAAPFIVDADASASSGPLEGGQSRIAFPNNHLEYAITWFALAVAWAVAFAVYAWGALKRAPAA